MGFVVIIYVRYQLSSKDEWTIDKFFDSQV